MTTATRDRLRPCAGAALAALLTACPTRPAAPPAPSFPASAALDCFVPTTDDYSVTIVVADTTFRDSLSLRPVLGAIAANWPVTLPLPRLALDISLDFYRDGHTSDPRMVKSSHVREFDRRALTAVRTAVSDTTWPFPPRYRFDTLRTLVRFGPPDANQAIVQTWYSVAKPPRPKRDNPQPNFPVEKNSGEQVIAEFTVDTLGLVDSSSVSILSSTNEDFAAAVLAVVPHWRFSPSTVRGCKVARTIRWEFPSKD